jgi:predicted AAA+ superfamily ATPase
MVQRQFWIEQIERAWRHRSVIWLSGVRRTGKTFLCQSLSNIEYFDCELPRVRKLIEDPQTFLENVQGHRVALDEIHRLSNPSELLKIAADYHKNTLLLATGSSTLGASTKFKDTLSDRKVNLWLTPMISEDMEDFGNKNLEHRLLRGGLPPFFLAKEPVEHDFQEWLDSYWAKDIQELFRLERRYSFLKFTELLMAQSGGIFEATQFSAPCEVSRTTITNYLKILEETFVVDVIRPYSTHRQTEIVSAPKVYAFDTGFVCYYRGWNSLRREDMGFLWEHFVLNALHAHLQSRRVYYWRDKRGHEVDFVLFQPGQAPRAIECKWSSEEFTPSNLQVFWRQYPKAEFFVVANDVERTFHRKYHGLSVHFVNLASLVKNIFD